MARESHEAHSPVEALHALQNERPYTEPSQQYPPMQCPDVHWAEEEHA